MNRPYETTDTYRFAKWWYNGVRQPSRLRAHVSLRTTNYDRTRAAIRLDEIEHISSGWHRRPV
jgi:hypothetical protein